MIVPAVAAGHPATAAAGAGILAAGGNAADAAVAAAFVSCVAETVMTGLLGGAHAIYHDAASATTRNLDCFVSVPSGEGGAPLQSLHVPFGDELVHYAIGASSCAVPGLPAGLDALWRAHGRLPWAELVEPALDLARSGVAMPRAHASCLAMLEPVMTMREGARMYAPHGQLLGEGDQLQQPGLIAALELVRDEGAASVYSGSIAASLLELVATREGSITAGDLASYAAVWSEPAACTFAGRGIRTRAGLSGIPETLTQLDPAGGADALLEALEHEPAIDGHTTNLSVVDHARLRGRRSRARDRLGGRDEAPHRPRRRPHGRAARRRATAGRDRPAALPSRRSRAERRARRRRELARPARGARPRGAPLARAAPLLRRRQRDWAIRSGRRSTAKRRREARLAGTTVSIHPT